MIGSGETKDISSIFDDGMLGAATGSQEGNVLLSSKANGGESTFHTLHTGWPERTRAHHKLTATVRCFVLIEAWRARMFQHGTQGCSLPMPLLEGWRYGP